MARSKHRKNHKEASARRSAYNRLVQRLEQVTQPVEVGKNRFQVLPDLPEEDVTLTMDGVTVAAKVQQDGVIRLEEGPNKGSLLQMDYRHAEEAFLGSEHFILNPRGTGKSREVKNFIAQAEAAGRAVLRADVLKREILDQFGIEAQQDGETIYVSVPKRQVQDVVDLAQRRTYSMGCDVGVPGGDKTVVMEGLPGRRMSMSEHLGKQEMGRMLRNFSMGCRIAGESEPPAEVDYRPLEARVLASEAPRTYPVTCPTCQHVANSREELCTHLWHPGPESMREALKRLESYPIPLAPPPMVSPHLFADLQDLAKRGPVHLTDYVGEATAMQSAMLGAAHLEPAWKLDENGKPCGIGEISLCPGPDPNGLTTLKSPEEPV